MAADSWIQRKHCRYDLPSRPKVAAIASRIASSIPDRSTQFLISARFQLLTIAVDLCRDHDLSDHDRGHLWQLSDRRGAAQVPQSAQRGRRLYHQVSVRFALSIFLSLLDLLMRSLLIFTAFA